MNISEKLLQQIANYLAKKPYAEVAGLINALSAEVKVQPEDKKTSKKDKKEDVKDTK